MAPHSRNRLTVTHPLEISHCGRILGRWCRGEVIGIRTILRIAKRAVKVNSIVRSSASMPELSPSRCSLAFDILSDGGVRLGVESFPGLASEMRPSPPVTAPAPPHITAPTTLRLSTAPSGMGSQRGSPRKSRLHTLHGSFAEGPSAVWRRIQPGGESRPYYYNEVLGMSRWSRPEESILGEGRSAQVQSLAPRPFGVHVSEWDRVAANSPAPAFVPMLIPPRTPSLAHAEIPLLQMPLLSKAALGPMLKLHSSEDADHSDGEDYSHVLLKPDGPGALLDDPNMWRIVPLRGSARPETSPTPELSSKARPAEGGPASKSRPAEGVPAAPPKAESNSPSPSPRRNPTGGSAFPLPGGTDSDPRDPPSPRLGNKRNSSSFLPERGCGPLTVPVWEGGQAQASGPANPRDSILSDMGEVHKAAGLRGGLRAGGPKAKRGTMPRALHDKLEALRVDPEQMHSLQLRVQAALEEAERVKVSEPGFRSFLDMNVETVSDWTPHLRERSEQVRHKERRRIAFAAATRRETLSAFCSPRGDREGSALGSGWDGGTPRSTSASTMPRQRSPRRAVIQPPEPQTHKARARRMAGLIAQMR